MPYIQIVFAVNGHEKLRAKAWKDEFKEEYLDFYKKFKLNTKKNIYLND